MEENMGSKIVKEIKDVDENVTGVIVPILRDTVADYRKVVNKLLVILIISILLIALVGGIGIYVIARQVRRYNDFLSQFDFESEDYIYQETDNNSTINSGINISAGE